MKTGVRNEKLRINTYGSPLSFLNQEPDIITVQCAKITNMDSEVSILETFNLYKITLSLEIIGIFMQICDPHLHLYSYLYIPHTL